MGRRTLLLIASILVAAVGTALIGLYVKGADDRASASEGVFQTLVATQEIAAGSAIEDAVAAMTVKAVPGRMGAGGFQGVDARKDALEKLKGQLTKESIYPEQTVLRSMFGPAGAATSTGITLDLAVAVELTDPARVAGLLTPGSYVTIFLIPNPGENGKTEQPIKITKNSVTGNTLTLSPPIAMPVILKKARVLGIGNQRLGSSSNANAPAAGTESDNVPRTIVTLDLTEKDASSVISAQSFGELYFAAHKED